MAGPRKPRGPVRITITANADGTEFFVSASNDPKKVEKRPSYPAARMIARLMYLVAGGDGKAIIVDHATHYAPSDVTYLPDGTIFIKPTGGRNGTH